jgi:hypothetical protein
MFVRIRDPRRHLPVMAACNDTTDPQVLSLAGAQEHDLRVA